MDKVTTAKLVLLQLTALEEGKDLPTTNLLTLVNEVLRDAKSLAEAVIAEAA